MRLSDLLLKHFEDRQRGGFFFTADDHERLITRTKDLVDASVPSGNGMAATALLRLGRLTGNTDYLAAAERAIAFALPTLARMPAAAGQLLIALDLWRGPASELVLVGGADETANQQTIAAIQQAFLPHSVVAYRVSANSQAAYHSPRLDQLFSGREALDAPALYVCQNFTCQAPVKGAANITAAVGQLR